MRIFLIVWLLGNTQRSPPWRCGINDSVHGNLLKQATSLVPGLPFTENLHTVALMRYHFNLLYFDVTNTTKMTFWKTNRAEWRPYSTWNGGFPTKGDIKKVTLRIICLLEALIGYFLAVWSVLFIRAKLTHFFYFYFILLCDYQPPDSSSSQSFTLRKTERTKWCSKAAH